jgi:D-alanine-D-alanine ligase
MTTNTTKHSQTVLILFGGESPEHDVSIMSAQNIYAGIDTAAISPILCYIDTQGKWWHVDTIAKPNQPTESITPLLGSSAIRIAGQETPIDVIFPVLHGKNGEDGTVQGLAKLMHTPIVGCGLDGSVLCIDKILAKQLLKAAGIPIVPFAAYHATEPTPDFDELAEQLGNTLFIKPVHQGSSVGVSKAQSKAGFTEALAEALRYDDDILIESAVSGVRELEVAVLGPTYAAHASVVGEIIPDGEFYSFASKYDSASTSAVTIPADISPQIAARIRAYAVQAFRVLHCHGLARVDFFLDAKGTIYLNEVNTLPGFTNISMYPKLWESTGLSYKALLQTLIDQAR